MTDQKSHGEALPRGKRHFPGSLSGRLDLRKHQTCVIEEGSPSRRELDSSRASGEELRANFLFEVADLAAKRGLRGVEFFMRCNREAAGVGDSDEVADVPKLHVSHASQA